MTYRLMTRAHYDRWRQHAERRGRTVARERSLRHHRTNASRGRRCACAGGGRERSPDRCRAPARAEGLATWHAVSSASSRREVRSRRLHQSTRSICPPPLPPLRRTHVSDEAAAPEGRGRPAWDARYASAGAVAAAGGAAAAGRCAPDQVLSANSLNQSLTERHPPMMTGKTAEGVLPRHAGRRAGAAPHVPLPRRLRPHQPPRHRGRAPAASARRGSTGDPPGEGVRDRLSSSCTARSTPTKAAPRSIKEERAASGDEAKEEERGRSGRWRRRGRPGRA